MKVVKRPALLALRDAPKSKSIELLRSTAVAVALACALPGCGEAGDGESEPDPSAQITETPNESSFEAPQRVLILLSERERNIDLVDTLRERIVQAGGNVRSVLGLAAIVAEMDADTRAALTGVVGVAQIHDGKITSPPDDSAELAAAISAWNKSLEPKTAEAPALTPPHPRWEDMVIPSDVPSDPAERAAKNAEYRRLRAARVLPSRLQRQSSACGDNGNDYYVTSPFMAGSVAVSVYFENGTAGAYTPQMAFDTFANVATAIEQFTVIQPNARLAFSFVIETDPSGNPLPLPADFWQHANELRDTWCTDWAFSVVVTNGGVWPNASLNGPRLNMENTFGSFADVLRHEVGHIFGAGDTYDPHGPSSRYGHARVTQGNACGNDGTGNFGGAGECLEDMMAGWGPTLGYNSRIGAYTAGQLGWYDTNGDGTLDVAETKPEVEAPTVTSQINSDRSVTFSGQAFDRAVLGFTGDKSINRLTMVQYRVDTSGWQDAQPTDGAFNNVRDGFQFTTPRLKNGNHVIQVRAVNSIGKVTPTAYSRSVQISGSTVTNTRPFGMLAVTPDRAKTGTLVTASAAGSVDLDGGTLQYSWNWGDSATWTAYSTTNSATRSNLPAGTYNVQVRVRDSGNLIHTLSRYIEVWNVNAAPIIAFKATPENRHLTTGNYSVTLDVNGSRDGETAASALQVQWDPEDDGVWSAWTTTKTLTQTLAPVSYPKSDYRRVRARIKDAAGSITEASRYIWVVPYNTAPTLNATTGVTFVPSGPSDYIATAHATDPNFGTTWDGILEYRADYENDGVWDTLFQSSPSFAVPAAKAGTLRVEVRDRFLARAAWQGGAPTCIARPLYMTSWWPFDAGMLNDIAGTFNNGTAANWPTEDWGAVAESMCFDGVDDLVTVASHADNDIAGDCGAGLEHFSVDAWVKTTASGTQMLLDKRQFTPNIQGWHMFIYNGYLGFQMATTSGYTNFVAPSTSPILNDGQWHLVAVTLQRCTSNGGKMYVDGNLVHTFTPRNGPMNNTVSLAIGGSYSGSGPPSAGFNGCLDEIEIFSRAITQTTIQSIYNAGPAGKCK